MNKREEVFYILILLVLCSLLFFFRLGTRPLWDTDEGMHASTSKDMVLSGDWITPTYNGENFYDKPILHNWFVSLSFLIFGFNGVCCPSSRSDSRAGGCDPDLPAGEDDLRPVGRILERSDPGHQRRVHPAFEVRDSRYLPGLFYDPGPLPFLHGVEWMKDIGRGISSRSYASLGFAVLAKGPVGVVLPGLIIGLFLLLKKETGLP